MTREEAKEILRMARPWAADDAEYREALELAQVDSELGEWLREQQNFHEALREHLRQEPAPPDLREQILQQSKVVKGSFWKGSGQRWVAAAAAVAILIVGFFVWTRAPGEDFTLAGFRSRMAGFALRQYSMDIHTPDEKAVRDYLAALGAPADFALPAGLAATPVKGGKSMSWQGKPVAMMCFDWNGQETLYLFVLRKEPRLVPGGGVPAGPEKFKSSSLFTLTWSNQDHIYLLAGSVAPAELERMLEEKRVGENGWRGVGKREPSLVHCQREVWEANCRDQWELSAKNCARRESAPILAFVIFRR